ncbi:hypothetical protein N7478_006107 [Penicillium angulare]|uniref:uncharacterized protein n=1 Tax=Penicillium angulare TaxID=116970 RepID=UPI00253FDB0B|nr:uncharacterized protein N7478_006107 [Penicillium angulare]KAJ5280735.1 hypothetical protein N7478_006107 [Penicillium angulare]
MKKRAKDKRTKWVAYAIAFVVAGAIALVLGFLGSGVIKNQPSPIERNDARPWTAGPVMQPADENIASTVASDSGEPIRRNSEMDPKLAAWFDSPENRVNDKGRSDRAG